MSKLSAYRASIYACCKYCGARRRLDSTGHYCPTKNCQWQFGYSTCTLHKLTTNETPDKATK